MATTAVPTAPSTTGAVWWSCNRSLAPAGSMAPSRRLLDHRQADVHHTALHYKGRLLEELDVLRRIAAHRDEIREAATRQRADVLFPAEEFRGVAGGDRDSFERRESAPLDEQFELSRVFAVITDAGVGTERDRHMVGPGD